MGTIDKKKTLIKIDNGDEYFSQCDEINIENEDKIIHVIIDEMLIDFITIFLKFKLNFKIVQMN
ncbi:hypothetical protein DERP_007571 [Dermatophagoides pteronyssinus]|uniref:Uncharacterized protein n=1 Tax=Dermatophagoides pteronyssinus TaxID=6956 RepID=A0ABQ8JKQ7_DERPT|nr:hypothetical protein DERP_007571 [Dermatophagoides pteronyssinus]